MSSFQHAEARLVQTAQQRTDCRMMSGKDGHHVKSGNEGRSPLLVAVNTRAVVGHAGGFLNAGGDFCDETQKVPQGHGKALVRLD